MPEQIASTQTTKPELYVEYDFASKEEAAYLHELDERMQLTPDEFRHKADELAKERPDNQQLTLPPKDDEALLRFAASSRGGRLIEFDQQTEQVIGEDSIIKDWIAQRNKSNPAVAPEFTAKIRARRLSLYAGRIAQYQQENSPPDNVRHARFAPASAPSSTTNLRPSA